VAAWVAAFEYLFERGGADQYQPDAAYCLRVGSELEDSPLARAVVGELARRHPDRAPRYCAERAGRPVRADGRRAWEFSVAYINPTSSDARTWRTSIYMESGPRMGIGWECRVSETAEGWRVHSCERGIVS
jgi:hypothetical protein